ncbi:GNAT family N-acetyltransferase [Streptosporangium lutulentum]|uniref:GNAT superfamily N-acetyltransferase n=1 Tax=Streptosporangium lutulentum TaxID=1461250 RepID=A0ABT9QDL2_9ACTN|nr:GNAT family N-acetyltransferase [Streptosporangium lutulentum]MDP9844816.1 GNAT superfamily N-acetyltransferase [Streptosporangium lutulentum]
MNVVVTMTPGGWTAHHGESAVGKAAAFVRPDDRCVVSFGSCRAEAYGPLARAVAQHFQRDLHTEIDESDTETHRHLAESGFAVHRREHLYAIPTDPAITGLAGGTAPPEFEIVTADQVDEDRLRELDDELRQDVPGADGWKWSPPGFRRETHDSPSFDPALYLVAVERSTGRYAGLVRVWNDPGVPRLGLIAVGRPYRRRGLASILLARAFAVLHERGKTEVTAEADVTNTGSTTLLTGLGARRTGGSVELVRPRPEAGPV